MRAYEKERAEGGTEREVGVYLSMFFLLDLCLCMLDRFDLHLS